MNTFGNITPDEGRTYLTNTYGPLMRNLTTLKKPIIAAINGTAAGVGASIALACDFRVMSENSGLVICFYQHRLRARWWCKLVVSKTSWL